MYKNINKWKGNIMYEKNTFNFTKNKIKSHITINSPIVKDYKSNHNLLIVLDTIFSYIIGNRFKMIVILCLLMLYNTRFQFINIVVNLLDALKTSFSHRSMAARSLGRKDSTSDAAIAGIAMLKTYAKSFTTNNDNCLQKYVCEASTECASDIGPKSVFCQLGTLVLFLYINLKIFNFWT